MSARTRNSSVRCSSGELELELIPQGTLAERLRAGGAGIPGFYTRTGFGTKLTEGKETKDFDGKEYVLEPGIKADVSIVKAWKGDKSGNLIFRKTSRNFNPMIATCGKICVAEVEELVEVGELDPGPGPHAGHLRRPHHPREEIREADRVPHRAGRRGCEGRIDRARSAGETGRAGAARRLLRQSRHRHPDAGRQLHSRRDERDPAIGERLARHWAVPAAEAKKTRT